MSKISLLIRYIFFCLFFAVGAGSMTLSFVAPELLKNYESIDQLRLAEANNEKLQQRIDTYDTQIEMVKIDPEILIRLEEKIFGTQTTQENAAFPHTSEGLTKLARKALDETDKSIAPQTKFRKCIELNPEHADAYNYLGYMYADDGINLDEAVSLVKKALVITKDLLAQLCILNVGPFIHVVFHAGPNKKGHVTIHQEVGRKHLADHLACTFFAGFVEHKIVSSVNGMF